MSSAPTPIAYQIDFSAVASGKRIASSKRRVRWRFGFANMDALAAGQTGTNCRGEEHDITLVWSITSGKRMVLCDGQEIHYSSSRNGLFDYTWTMRGNHVLKIVAHASPPLSPTPGFRQYDFFVDGQSFFHFPKVFRLGLAPGAPTPRGQHFAERSQGAAGRGPSSNLAAIEAPTNPEEEEEFLKEAIRQSMQDAPPTARGAAPATSNDLLDFSPTPAAALPPSTAAPYGQSNPYGAPQPQQSSNPYNDSTQQFNPYASQQSIGSDPFGGGFSAAPVAPYGQQQSQPNYGQSTSNYGYQTQPPTSAPLPALPASTTAPQTNGFSQNPYAPEPPAQQQPAFAYGTSTWNPPPAIDTRGSWEQPQSDIPSAFTPQAQQTPSTIGFQSPVFTPGPALQQTSQAATYSNTFQQQAYTAPSQSFETPAYNAPVQSFEAPAPVSNQPKMSMGSLYGQEGLIDNNNKEPGRSLTEQAYSKLVNLDSLSLVSDTKRSNPFESTTDASQSVGGFKSLADMKKSGSSEPKKEVMKPPTTLVVSSQQSIGNNYGGQYGVAPGGGGMLGGATQFGQAPMPPQQYGQASPMQQQYGQQTPIPQPQYGQQQYGQQAPIPQPQYGQQAPAQQQFGQQQFQYGQAPF